MAGSGSGPSVLSTYVAMKRWALTVNDQSVRGHSTASTTGSDDAEAHDRDPASGPDVTVGQGAAAEERRRDRGGSDEDARAGAQLVDDALLRIEGALGLVVGELVVSGRRVGGSGHGCSLSGATDGRRPQQATRSRGSVGLHADSPTRRVPRPPRQAPGCPSASLLVSRLAGRLVIPSVPARATTSCADRAAVDRRRG
jgi:hypothetical protein